MQYVWVLAHSPHKVLVRHLQGVDDALEAGWPAALISPTAGIVPVRTGQGPGRAASGATPSAVAAAVGAPTSHWYSTAQHR